jgi:hypothetical protein
VAASLVRLAAGYHPVNADELTWLVETLEAYRTTKASDYPDAALTEMKDIFISTGSTPAQRARTGPGESPSPRGFRPGTGDLPSTSAGQAAGQPAARITGQAL